MEHAELERWTGRTRSSDDLIAPGPAAALAATLDRDDPPAEGEPLPPAWHWIYFHEVARMSALGPDGHARRGGFLPPVPLPRRMWAGGRMTFDSPLRVGERVRRVSTVRSITPKSGRSGELVFVVVRHEFFAADGELRMSEEHDILYREMPRADAPAPTPRPAPATAAWSREVRPDPVLLFRYSALTFNGHRIHYDREYCREEEGYPGLVVHGPLTATLLLDGLRRQRPEAALVALEYRAVAPLFDTAPYTVNGCDAEGGALLFALGPDGGLAMTMEVSLAA